MKRHLYFYYWLAAVIMMMCSTATISAQVKVTSLSQLKAGSVIKIYPKDSNGTSHYGESYKALACSGNGKNLTSYWLAGCSGDSWTLVDAGDGYYYLKNNLGCYWAYQSKSLDSSLTCTTSESSAVKISLTWDSTYRGVCFWNKQDRTGLNNLKGYGRSFNWWSSRSDYVSDANTTFDIAVIQEGSGESVVENTKEVVFEGVKYLLNLPDKTAAVLPNNYSGDIVIPQNVTYDGNDYAVTSLEYKCFYSCSGLTSITLPDGITSLGDLCFDSCSGLTSITLPDGITSLGHSCFYSCSGLTSITLPDGITSLGHSCFYSCSGLTSITLPDGITSLGDVCFGYCTGLKELSLPASLKNIGYNILIGIDNNFIISCLAQTPPEISDNNFRNSKYRLFVPKESLEKYKSTSPWNNAYSINPLYPATSVVLPAEASIVKTKPMTLNYSILPENAGTKTVTWNSENLDIASVDAAGMITGKKVGTVKIIATATDGTDVSAFTTLTVLPLPVESIIFADQKVSVTKTKSATVSITANPVDADNKNVTWTSSDESVATVAQSADASKPFEAIVTGNKVGKATIKAEAQDGSGVTATCEVEVTPLMVSDFAAKTISVVKTIPTKMEMEITPAEADNQNLKWTSLTPDIATITGDGTLIGQKMGTAKLQAVTTDGSNISKTFDVQVTGLPVSSISLPKESSIIKTEKQKLEYSIFPIASDNQTLKWSSNAPTIASVDETSGIITAHKVGNAVITATATDGSGISASTTIHVTPLKVSHLGITKEMSLLRTTTGQIETTIEPELADNKTLKWTSDDENIATVTQKGVVKGVNVGTANITATTTDGSNLSATCKVTVTPVTIDLSTKTINLRKGDSYAEQMVNVLPENYEHRDVSWSSSDNGVASVNASGIITAVKPGITTIKYMLDYDNNISSECKVIVYEDNVVYVGGIYYILDKESKEATVTSIYGGKNTSLDAKNVAQYYSGTINIPETVIYDGDKYTVKKVGSYAFNCQNDLQSIIVPRTVTMIQDNAAIKAENLNRVNVANESQLVSIGKQAFMECTGLKRFTFDGTSLFMNIIDKETFKNCTALERVTWTDDNLSSG